MTTARFIPDSKIPEVKEVDLGNGIRQLIIKYKDAEEPKPQPVLHAIQFLPRTEKIIDVVPVKKGAFPLHDFVAHSITFGPIVSTLLFADILVKSGALLPLGIASVIWIWLILMINTRWK